MTSKSLETVPLNVPSYEETMNGTTPHLYPNPMPMPHYPPQTVQPSTPQPQVHNMQPVVNNIHIGSNCSSCRQPSHTRISCDDFCTKHCTCLFCCFFLWDDLCDSFANCLKACFEPRLCCASRGGRTRL